jgi:putative holliday junction resolvase
MRILGIDYGDRNVGLALSDSLRVSAQPLETYRLLDKEAEDAAYFRDLVKRYDIGEVVLGNPLRMDGTSGTRAEKTRAFADWLIKAAGVPVVFWDERLTTRQAMGVVHEQKVRRQARKSVLNQVAAAIILQSYLDSKRDDAHFRQDR